jgi:hypothetical protein
VALAAPGGVAPGAEAVRVTTAAGTLVGTSDGAIACFTGIPYARPPYRADRDERMELGEQPALRPIEDRVVLDFLQAAALR